MMKQIGHTRWNVFISYASEDRKVVVEPLLQALRESHISVWYDRLELRLGDSLRRKIDEGLTYSDYGIVILSQHFLAKHFTNLELNGLAQREVNGNDVILPIWYNVNADDVRRYSPTLADKVAANWSDGLPSVVQQVLAKVREEPRDTGLQFQGGKARSAELVMLAHQGDICPQCKKGKLYFLEFAPGLAGPFTVWYECSKCQAVIQSNREFDGGLI